MSTVTGSTENYDLDRFTVQKSVIFIITWGFQANFPIFPGANSAMTLTKPHLHNAPGVLISWRADAGVCFTQPSGAVDARNLGVGVVHAGSAWTWIWTTELNSLYTHQAGKDVFGIVSH